jgi:hypothetical protein
MKKYIQDTDLGKTITDLVVFSPKVHGFEKGVINFFKTIKEVSEKKIMNLHRL